MHPGVRRVVKQAVAVADRFAPKRPGIVVLLYHRVGAGAGGEIDLPVEMFDAQIAAIADRAVTLERALALLAGKPTDAGPSPVVVTFDDGTADVCDVAVPVLVRYGVPAYLYLATSFVEQGTPISDGARPASWAGLRDAMATGLLAVGSHTHSHALLDRLDPTLVAGELDRSIDLIGDRLGVRAEHFAYPKALPASPVAAEAVRQRFRSAALAGTRANPYGGTDPYRLARSPIQVSDGMRWFERKLAGGMALEDDLRRLANRGRYAGATT